jgi:hypothetical protein
VGYTTTSSGSDSNTLLKVSGIFSKSSVSARDCSIYCWFVVIGTALRIDVHPSKVDWITQNVAITKTFAIIEHANPKPYSLIFAEKRTCSTESFQENKNTLLLVP